MKFWKLLVGFLEKVEFRSGRSAEKVFFSLYGLAIMEVSVIGSSQTQLAKTDLAYRELGFCNLKDNSKFSAGRISFSQRLRWKKAGIRFNLKAVQSEVVQTDKPCGSGKRSKSVSFVFLIY